MLNQYLKAEPTLSLSEVLKAKNKSYSWLFEQVRLGNFPPPDRKSGRKIFWRKSTLERTMNNCTHEPDTDLNERNIKLDLLTEQENIISFSELSQFPSTVSIKSFGEIAGINVDLFRRRFQSKFYILDDHFEHNLKLNLVKINSEAMSDLLKNRRDTKVDEQPIKLGFREDKLVEDYSNKEHLSLQKYIEIVDISVHQIIARLAQNEWKIGKHIRLDFQRKINKKEASIHINLRAVQQWATSN